MFSALVRADWMPGAIRAPLGEAHAINSADTFRERAYDAFVRGDICQDLPRFLWAQVWTAVLSKLPPVPMAKEDHHRRQLEHARLFG
jgi:hypothetical protein